MYFFEQIRVIVPSRVPLDLVNFSKPPNKDSSFYSFMVIARKRLGICIREWTPNTPASPNCYRCHLCICESAVGNKIKREKLVYLCGNGDIPLSRIRKRYTCKFFLSLVIGSTCAKFALFKTFDCRPKWFRMEIVSQNRGVLIVVDSASR